MPQHKRGPWSQTEDQHLLHLVSLYGAHNWVRISSTIQTRSPKQCRERYHQNLKPNLNHDPITPEEGVLIEQMVAEMGKRWAEIARRLRGRSDNAVKNWWNGGMNRRRRSNNQRRQDFDVRQPASAINGHVPSMPGQHMHIPQQPLPQALSHTMPYQQYGLQVPQQYIGQPVYSNPQWQPQQVTLPSNGPPLRHHGIIDTPLPSPSTFSQLSADGAPSLMSDCSSLSNKSPPSGTSPIELPPLSGQRDGRRQPSAPQVRIGLAGTFAYDGEMQMQMKQDPQPMLQAPFMTQPMHHQPQSMQSFAPHQNRYYIPDVPPHYAVHALQRQHSFPAAVHDQHLPRLTHNLGVSAEVDLRTRTPMSSMHMDADLIPLHGTPSLPSAPTPDGSPKDKMSLSAITH